MVNAPMKYTTIAAVILLSTGAVSAAPFGYQQQVGSSELDPSIWEGPAVTAQSSTASNFTLPEIGFYEKLDIDGGALFAYQGENMPSVFSGSSNYEQVME
jgi:hypothetical protein